MSDNQFFNKKPQAKLQFQKQVFLLYCLAVLLLNWVLNEVTPGQLATSVQPLMQIPAFESKGLYAALLLFTFSFPALFGFLPQLKFYQQWPRFWAANWPVTLIFLVWDWWFTRIGVWDFSERYTLGWNFWGLPLEECLFFVLVPAACVFIYFSLLYFFPEEPFARYERGFTLGMAAVFLVLGFWYWAHIYTATTTLACGFVLLFQVFFGKKGFRGRFYLAYVLSCIPFLLVNGILTGGATQSPVVFYNPEEFCGYRLGTVPLDDFTYSFLLLFGNVTLFERQRTKNSKVWS